MTEESAVVRSFGEISDKSLAEAEQALAYQSGNYSQSLNWDDLLQSDRVIIISVAGSGKTYECQSCQRKLWREGEPAFFIELSQLALNSLETLLSPPEEVRLDAWRISQSGVATFFLDSIDELNLTRGSLKVALTKLAKAIDSQLSRARIVVTTRPTPFDKDLVAKILPIPPILKAPPSEQDFASTAIWSRRFIEGYFGRAVADKMREALCRLWRADRLTLRSERPAEARNTFLTRWQLGLAGIAAEAEDRDWAKKLTREEARLACRYAPIQLNGLPHWLDDIARFHNQEVDYVLGAELIAELELGAGPESTTLVTSISYSTATLRAVFRDRLIAWLDDREHQIRKSESAEAYQKRICAVIEVLLQDGDSEARRFLHALATGRLQAQLCNLDEDIWLPLLMKLDPEAGMTALEAAFQKLEPLRYGRAVNLIAELFSGRHSAQSLSATNHDFTPQLLLCAVRVAFKYVRTEDDHHREGAYSPTARDNAEHARSALLGALLQAKGQEGWAAKLSLSEVPNFLHMRDRIIAIAREKAVQDADGEPFGIASLLEFDRSCETPPLISGEMFALIKDRLDDIDDLLLHDDSPRENWASIRRERIMRRAISHELQIAARHMYSVVQESVTADENETDIRLRSNVGVETGVIELKIGGSWSINDLRDALSNQLIRKYMAPENCRAGYLLITATDRRKWKHPNTGEMLSLTELVALLNEHARRIVDEMGGTLRVAVRGLYLGPRL